MNSGAIPALPILIGNDIFVRGVRRGIDQGEYVYRRGELLFGPGDPSANIVIDEQSVIFTMVFAKNAGIWPRTISGKPSSAEPGSGENRQAGWDTHRRSDRGPGWRPSSRSHARIIYR